jgi:hypothetical protein
MAAAAAKEDKQELVVEMDASDGGVSPSELQTDARRVGDAESPVFSQSSRRLRDMGIVFLDQPQPKWPVVECPDGAAEVLQKRNAVQDEHKASRFTIEHLKAVSVMMSAYHWECISRRQSPPVIQDPCIITQERHKQQISHAVNWHRNDTQLFVAGVLAVGVLTDRTVLIKPTRMRSLAMACYLIAAKSEGEWHGSYKKVFATYGSTPWMPPIAEVFAIEKALLHHYSYELPRVFSVHGQWIAQLFTHQTALELRQELVEEASRPMNIDSHTSSRRSEEEITAQYLQVAQQLRWFYACVTVFESRLNLIEFASWPQSFRVAFRDHCNGGANLTPVKKMLEFAARARRLKASGFLS